MVEDAPLADRLQRLSSLQPSERSVLASIVGEAVLDFWIYGEACPDIVERCLEAAEAAELEETRRVPLT